MALFGGNHLLALPTFTEVSGSAHIMYNKWVSAMSIWGSAAKLAKSRLR